MKKVFVFVFVSVWAFWALGISAFADVGPKDSVTVYVNGVEDGREYYVALIEKKENAGYNDKYIEGQDKVWRTIYEFTRSDGYYPADSPVDSSYYKLKGSDSARWGYHPPYTFKILLYFPDNESFLLSNQYKKYAFNSYFDVNVNGNSVKVEIAGGNKRIAAEIAGLLLRIAITVLIEVGIAKGYGIFGKKSFRLIIIMNIATQLLLNALLWKANYDLGVFGEVLALFGGEILVLIVEAIFYSALLPEYTGNEIKGGRAARYALAANLASFVGGGVLLFVGDMLISAIR